MICRAQYISRAATLGGALGLILISSVNDAGTQSAPGRVIWRGVNTVTSTGPKCNSQLVQTFEFVGEEVPNTDPKWLSRKVTWDWSESCAAEILVLEATGGATPQRVRRPWTASCVNKGEADLNLDPNPERRGQCQESPALGHISNYIYPTLGWTGPRPPEQMRNGCAYASRSRILGGDGSVHVTTYSVTVSRRQPDAVVEVDRREYEAFVPEPGKTLTFTAKSSRPARFRFELDRAGTSRFPGYATNANVDDVFFMKHNLGHLRAPYANDGPDVIFDPENFGERGWSRRDLNFIETRTAATGALVPVTAMDYGAVGRLRAYVHSEDCGGSWHPVNIIVNGQPLEAIDIPLDADDNLIADALEQYRGLDSGSDSDAEPKGNGMSGDGLTAFEEYRGFLTRGPACPGQTESALTLEPGMPPPEPFPDEQLPSGVPGWDDEHIRSAPHHKDLFVHTPDPELVVMLDGFGWASGLSVHAICEPHYIDNDSRIVNFTLQQASSRTWRGRTVSQEQAQHGVAMLPVEETQYANSGVAFPVVTGTSGPPKFTWYIEINKPLPIPGQSARISRAVEDRLPENRGLRNYPLEWIVVHELGHAVGVTHHADDVREWRDVLGRLNVSAGTSPRQRAGGPIDFSRDYSVDDFPDMLLVEPGPECGPSDDSAAYTKGQFVGCLATGIARRGQQNSGEMDCPMRYAFADWYEPPRSTAVYLYPGFVTLGAQSREANPLLVKVDAWGGRLRRYRDDLDRVPEGKMCVNIRGTGINNLSGHMNHAGDAGRNKACADFIVVNDVAAPDPRP